MATAELNTSEGWGEQGQRLWAALHTWAFGADLASVSQWLAAFELRIPCGDCAAHWREWVAEHPPDASGHHALFAWTVSAHNAVNRMLGKEQWSQQVAWARWHGQDPAPLPPTHLPATDGSRRADVPAENPAPVNCVHAGSGPRPTKVHCALGLFGGMPHVALCNQCTSRVPRDPNTPALPPPPSQPAHQEIVAPSRDDGSRLLLQCRLSPGDVLMMTAAVRDLHRAHPGRFVTAVDTPTPDIWENNPLVTPADSRSWRVIQMEYPLINQSNERPVHFLQGYCDFLAATLGVPIPVSEFRGSVYVSEQEKQWMNQVHERFGYNGPFWIMMAGGKYDMTAKWWPPASYQKVVDHFLGRLQFVQCGQADHWHPPLKGVFNLVGQTSIRQFVRLMYHARGVVCPVTFAMHLSAAVPTAGGRLRPCVVVAGGREPPHWEAYPGHHFLHTIGSLPCCGTGGCWRSRCQTVCDGDPKDAEGLCERPVYIDADLRVPQCMTLIRPTDVIAAIERSLVCQ